ncbi:MAG: Ig-like domain-containing protein [Bacteroidales bacterium]|nr:Ig-like domain-containing protein [Bacteroidales bacterium]
MKRILISAIALLLALTSCIKETGNNPIKELPQVGVTLVSIDNITATSAIVKGQVSYPEDSDRDLYVLGALYYLAEKNVLESMDVYTTKVNPDDSFEVELKGLAPGTDYRCVLDVFNVLNSDNIFSEEAAFSTKSIYKLISTAIAGNISTSGATLNAKLDLGGKPASEVEYGFKWGMNKDNLNRTVVSHNLDGGAYSATLSDLSLNTEYYYQAYVTLDGATLFGDIVKFSTFDDISVIVTDYDRVSSISAQISGQFYLPSDIKAGNAEYGVIYLTSPIFNLENAIIEPARSRDGDNNFTVPLLGLNPATTYYCFTYVYLTDSKNFTISEQSIKIKTSPLSDIINPESFSKNGTDVTLTGRLFIPETLPEPEDYGFLVFGEDGSEMRIKMPSYDKSNCTIQATVKNLTIDVKYTFGVYVKFPFREYNSENTIEFKLYSIEDIHFDRNCILLYPGESGIRLEPVIKPDDAPDKRLRWTSMNPDVVEVDDSGNLKAKKAGSANITVISMAGSRTATFTVVVDEGVDMDGKLCWSNYNVGAASVDAYGDFFPFGTKLLSSVWRVPTETELKNMIYGSEYKGEWQGSSKGLRVYCKGTSKSLFLPAAGIKWPNYVFANIYGYYWTSTDTIAFDFFASPLSIGFGGQNASYKMSIRPVRNK